MASPDTRVRILDASEQLFAEQGFDETTLRQITTRAGVNLASVNYHFGSKKALSQAALDRYMSVFMPALDCILDSLLKQPTLTIEQLFSSFFKPLLTLDQFRPNGSVLFMQMMGRGYSERQGHLRRYMFESYGEILHKLQKTVERASPQLSPAERFWRLHFTLGTLIFVLESATALQEIALADFEQKTDNEAMLMQLLPYLAAGFNAPHMHESVTLTRVG